MDFLTQIQQCAPTVHADTMRRIVQVESGFNPYAIGVVGAHLERQPRSHAEALAAISWLDANGYNYSVGLAQVNKRNFPAHGLTVETALQACPNLRAGGAILTACFARASKTAVPSQTALRAAFSCYESGNFVTGFKDGYVLKVLGSGKPTYVATSAARPPASSRGVEKIDCDRPKPVEANHRMHSVIVQRRPVTSSRNSRFCARSNITHLAYQDNCLGNFFTL